MELEGRIVELEQKLEQLIEILRAFNLDLARLELKVEQLTPKLP